MRHYEVTFIVDPVLTGDEIKSTATVYQDMLTKEGAKIVNTDEMGLRQLAYPIKKRSSGIYYCVEFETELADLNSKIELAMRRDERIMRFLVAKLDKYGVQYNADKRAGKIGKAKRTIEREKAANAKAKAAKTKYVAPESATKAAAKPTPIAKVVAKPAVAETVTKTVGAAEEE